ncbi:ATP-binding cassette domain-containing protein [Streptomyces sp. NPDC048330]|uniref:ATP-binding cassette domain-containing protein n=1 Tax=Streptomyces sp. NPDC048330 TaxID=3365533 RepID=UPI003712F6F7
MIGNNVAILAEGVSRNFGDVVAVDHVDVAVRTGEIYGFLGPNGAGKSTLTRVLCTLLKPTGGRAEVAGHDVSDRPEMVRLNAGVALQEAALDDKQSGAEMLALQGRFYGMSRAATRARIGELAELVDLGDALQRRVRTYSGGMKRRLDLALALIHDPSVLFLDEPTTGLDPASRSRVWSEVQRLNTETSMTVFLTTQYLEEADQLADRVGIIHHGKLVAEGTPDELKRSIGTDLVVVTFEGSARSARQSIDGLKEVKEAGGDGQTLVVSVTDGPSAISPVAVALSATPDIRVKNITLRRPSLDDVFASVTGERINSQPSVSSLGTAPQDTAATQ